MTQVGPRPVAEPALKLSAARAAVLAYLVETDEPATVQTVAASSGQHPNTVREHLEALVELGFVTRDTLPPQGRGRPAIAYAVRAGSTPLRSTREYASLVDALVAQLKATSSDIAADSLAVGQRWAEEVKADEPLPELLTRMGFDPVRESPRSLLLSTCPVLSAAQNNPDAVCVMHRGFLRAITDQEVDLEPFVDGGCRLHLAKALPEAVRTGRAEPQG